MIQYVLIQSQYDESRTRSYSKSWAEESWQWVAQVHVLSNDCAVQHGFLCGIA